MRGKLPKSMCWKVAVQDNRKCRTFPGPTQQDSVPIYMSEHFQTYSKKKKKFPLFIVVKVTLIKFHFVWQAHINKN